MPLFVKICGVTEERAIAAAVEAGADAVGFVLAPSPRRVSIERALALSRVIPPSVARVAVLAAASRDEILAIDDRLRPDLIQADAASLAPVAGRIAARAMPVLRDGPGLLQQLDALLAAADTGPGGWIVIDGSAGGKGVTVDRTRAAAAARHASVVLAGGLDPETVADTIAFVRPAGVDVSSGVESRPGIKDPQRVAAFVAAARRAALAPPGGRRREENGAGLPT